MSLEGLNSLIQLESTRLEAARQTSSNSQAINSTVQQQGTQVAQSRTNMSLQRIDAQYNKECAEADVRKLERKLARERASEALSMSIANVALIANAVGNLGHLFNDLNGRQKLGDTPDYLKSPPLKPGNTELSVTQDANSAANFIYLSGTNDDGSETVYSYRTGQDGVSTSDLPRAATITEYDKKRILGADYDRLKSENGGKSLSFAEIRAKDPQLAEKLMSARGHGVSSSEAKNLMEVAEAKMGGANVSVSQLSNGQRQTQGAQDANRLAAISAITSPGSVDAEKIAALKSFIKPEEKDKFFPNDSRSLDEILNDPASRSSLLENSDFTSRIKGDSSNAILQDALYTLNNHNGKDTKFLPEQIEEMDKNLTAADKAKVFGAGNGNKPLSQILEDPAMMEKFVNSDKMKNDFDALVTPFASGEVYNSEKNEDGTENVQYNDNGIAFEYENISEEDKKAMLGDKYNTYKDKPFAEIFKKEPDVAKGIITGMLSRDFNESLTDKQKKEFKDKFPEAFDDKFNNKIFNSLSKENKEKIVNSNPELFTNGKFDQDKFNGLSKEKKDEFMNSHPELFFSPQKMGDFMASNPTKANEAVKSLDSGSDKSRVRSLEPRSAISNVDDAQLRKNLNTSVLSLKDSLVAHGKIDNRDFIDKTMDFGKKAVNFLVTTMEQTIPYFQAYLKAKQKADATYEELIAAKDKLNAANKKLKAMEMQIDAFSGRGA